jgi:hypothetical protein
VKGAAGGSREEADWEEEAGSVAAAGWAAMAAVGGSKAVEAREAAGSEEEVVTAAPSILQIQRTPKRSRTCTVHTRQSRQRVAARLLRVCCDGGVSGVCFGDHQIRRRQRRAGAPQGGRGGTGGVEQLTQWGAVAATRRGSIIILERREHLVSLRSRRELLGTPAPETQRAVAVGGTRFPRGVRKGRDQEKNGRPPHSYFCKFLGKELRRL